MTDVTPNFMHQNSSSRYRAYIPTYNRTVQTTMGRLNNQSINRQQTGEDFIGQNILENTISQAPTSSQYRIIFKYDINKGIFKKTDFSTGHTNNMITEVDIDILIEDLKLQEDITNHIISKNDCQFTCFIVLLILVFQVFSLFCVYPLLITRSDKKRRKFDERTSRIKNH